MSNCLLFCVCSNNDVLTIVHSADFVFLAEMGIRHSKASVDISTTPKVPEPSAVEVNFKRFSLRFHSFLQGATVTGDGDVAKGGDADAEVRSDTNADVETKEEPGHLKPELLDVKESKVASLRRNLSFNKLKKIFSKGDGEGANIETKEGVDEAKGEVAPVEVGDAPAKEEAEKETAIPEKSNAEGDTKATILKNSLIKMFSRESGDNETTSTNKEGIEEQCPESAGDGLKREESLEEKVDEVSRVTNLKKRLSFKAIKSRFTKEKKEEEVAPPEGGNEGTGEKAEVEEEVKSGEDERKEDTKDEALRDDTGMGPPAEAPPG